MTVALCHAAQRAKERYGIELTNADVREIARRCKAGEGQGHTDPDGKRGHTIIFKDRVLWVVYAPPEQHGTKLTDGVVVTVMPPEAAAKVAWRDGGHRIRRLRGHAGSSRRR